MKHIATQASSRNCFLSCRKYCPDLSLWRCHQLSLTSSFWCSKFRLKISIENRKNLHFSWWSKNSTKNSSLPTSTAKSSFSTSPYSTPSTISRSTKQSSLQPSSHSPVHLKSSTKAKPLSAISRIYYLSKPKFLSISITSYPKITSTN